MTRLEWNLMGNCIWNGVVSSQIETYSRENSWWKWNTLAWLNLLVLPIYFIIE
jgi:hypothetical protein